MQFVIHAGRHKTATTYLQRFFSSNDAELQKRGILYPKTGRGVSAKSDNHHGFFKHLLFGSPSDRKIQGDLEKEVEQAQPSLVVMSSEVVSRPVLTSIQLVRLREHLPWDPVILIYLRRQDDFLRSMYAEHVSRLLKNGPVMAPFAG